MIHEWGAKHGFRLFAPEGHRSFALTCFATPETLDLSGFIKALKTKYNFLINGGYGKVKGTTFRISNMGNETEATMQELINAMDDILKDL
jgi:aspartate aminotransferase-like enzyme